MRASFRNHAFVDVEYTVPEAIVKIHADVGTHCSCKTNRPQQTPFGTAVGISDFLPLDLHKIVYSSHYRRRSVNINNLIVALCG